MIPAASFAFFRLYRVIHVSTCLSVNPNRSPISRRVFPPARISIISASIFVYFRFSIKWPPDVVLFSYIRGPFVYCLFLLGLFKSGRPFYLFFGPWRTRPPARAGTGTNAPARRARKWKSTLRTGDFPMGKVLFTGKSFFRGRMTISLLYAEKSGLKIAAAKRSLFFRPFAPVVPQGRGAGHQDKSFLLWSNKKRSQIPPKKRNLWAPV